MKSKKIICASILVSLFFTIPSAANYAVKDENNNNTVTPIEQKNHSSIKWPDKSDKYPILYVLPPQNTINPGITSINPPSSIDSMPLISPEEIK